MKVLSKIAVIAAALLLISVFTGCKTEEESDVLAYFEYEGNDLFISYTFNKDNTLSYFANDNDVIWEGTGTYNGDVTLKNVKGTFTWKELYKDGKIQDLPENPVVPYEIKDDVLYIGDLIIPRA